MKSACSSPQREGHVETWEESRLGGVAGVRLIDAPQMLLLGSAEKDSGETEFACSVIDKFRADHEVVGVKVTTVQEAEGRAGLATNYLITQEIDEGRGKDTERMAAAGGSKVYWLRVYREHLYEGAVALLERIGKDAFVVCESNSLRSVLEPALFFIFRRRGLRGFKESAEAVRTHMDRLVTFSGRGPDLDLDDIDIRSGQWILRAEASAIVLAGGASHRMHRDKSMLPMDSVPMIEHIHGQLRPHFKQMLVSANDIEKYAFLGSEVVPDGVAGCGPMMGILSALEVSEHDINFVTACDMPNINIALVRRMLRESEGFDAVVPVADGWMETLFAVYCKSMMEPFKDALAQGERKIKAVFDALKINYVDITESGPLENLNTREDYAGFISHLAEKPKR